MRVLVVGGAGYVGSELCARLLERGHEVEVDDLLVYGQEPMSVLMREYPDRFKYFQEDISSDSYGQGSMLLSRPRVDVCVNLSGFSNDPIAQAYPALNWKWNVYGAAKVAEACRNSNIRRLIYASSASVYHTEDFAFDVELGEGAPVRPHWHYSISKYAGELATSAFHEKGVLDVVIVRKGTVCGVSRRMRYDLMLNAMFSYAATRQGITVDGAGGVYRPLLDIKDAVSAYVALVEADQALVSNHSPEIFNVVSENDKVISFANRLAKVVSAGLPGRPGSGIRTEVSIGPPRAVQRSYRISSRKMAERIGWFPEGSCETIGASLLESFFAYKLPAFGNPQCYNIKTLKMRKDLR